MKFLPYENYLVSEKGFVTAFGSARERPFVVVHPQMPLQPRLFDKTFTAVSTLERFLKRQMATSGGCDNFRFSLGRIFVDCPLCRVEAVAIWIGLRVRR